MEPRTLARALALGRIAFGATVVVAPRLVIDRQRQAPGPVVWFVRAFGIRDVAIGAGTFRALSGATGGEADWVALSAATDAADAVAAVVFGRDLDRRLQAVTLAMAVPAALAGWKAAGALR
jgi:hypothetical protein